MAGRGLAVATRTGPDSGLGRIAALVHASGPGRTPLQRRLAGLGRVLGATAVVASAVVFGLGILSGQPVLDMAIAAVSLVVAAVPESLPAVVTLALALAARRMAAQRAIPRQLPAVETLGAVTVVASDKTGTITEGRMSVQTVVDAAGREYRATGVGYDPVGQITGLTEAPPPELLALARAGLLCNDASLTPPDPDGNTTAWTAIGDPLEAALLAFAARCGLDIAAERAEWPRIAEEPFDQQTRRMTTTHARFDGARLTVCKGAPESVLHAPILASPPPAAVEAAHRLATAGLRVVVVAGARAPAGTEDRPLEYLGVIGIGDPVRATARGVADEFDRAGIRLLLITGDHPGTASAVGAHLGIWREGDEVHHGDSGPPDAARAAKVRVFARTQPEQKLDIIAGLQSRGHVVAMTGDGVNDAPALRRADIGVAMGGGTEVARQAADVVLVDDNLATLSGAVREGRRIYDNIRRFLLYGLAGGTAEILVMLCGPLVGLPLPLLPAQILWINLLTHGVPGVAMGAEPAEADVMSRPPRPPGESVLGDGLLRGILLAGSVLAATTLAAGGAGYLLGRPWQSMIFVTLGLAQLAVALAVRVRVTDGPRSRALLVAVAVSVVLQLAGVWFPPLQALLGTEPLTLSDLAICLPLAIIPAVVVRLRRAGRLTDTIRP